MELLGKCWNDWEEVPRLIRRKPVTECCCKAARRYKVWRERVDSDCLLCRIARLNSGSKCLRQVGLSR